VGKRIRVLIGLLVVSGVGIIIGSSLGSRGDGGPETLPPSAIPGSIGRVKVEVLNGGGLEGVAWDATRALRDAGFDVVYYGNAGTYSDEPSVVMDRVGDLEKARSVAEALGILQVISTPDSTRLVDVTVRLGPDWTGEDPADSGTADTRAG
jgi:hypothetical protein